MSIGPQFATRSEVEAMRRKLARAISGASIVQHESDDVDAVKNFVELADVPQTYAGATGELPSVNAAEDGLEFNPYVTVNPTTPILKLRNLTDAEVDCVHQFAVGASPVVKWTYGLDDSDDNKWKLAVGDKFGEDYDTIVVSPGEGSAPPIAEFTLIDSFTTGTHVNPRGVCADANYVYYSFQDQLVKIDKTTGAELAISAAVPLNTYNMYSCVTDGTYVYVACRGNGKIRKYLCSDLAYDSTSGYWDTALTGLAYRGGYLYITSYSTDNIRKIRCLDMVTQWTTAFTEGAGDNQLDDPYGIAADNQYVYVQDLDNDRIVRLNASDGSWVDTTAVPQTFSANSWAMWCAGDYLYNTALYAANDCKVEKRNKADLSISETFDMATNYAVQGWQRDDYHYVVDGIAEFVYKYQYVSFGGAGNSHIKFRLKDAYGQFNDIAILTDEVRLGVGTTIPSETIEAVGNIKATAGQFISTKATGTAPHVVSSTTVCTNLNAGLVDGYHHDQSLLIAASPTFVALNLSATSNQIILQSAGVTGTITATPASSNKVWTLQNVTGTIYQTAGTDVAVADGGTGKSSFTQYAIPYASAATTIGEIAIGAAGKVLAVAAGATGYEWIAPGGGAAAFLDLTDVDEADYVGHEAEFIVVNGTADGLVFSASSVAGHTLGGVNHTDVNAAAPNDDDFLSWDAASGKWIPVAGGGGGAPTDAKYIVQEVNAGLSAEQSLGALATGIVKNTTTGAVGVLSIATATDIPAVAISTTTITATGATNWNKVSGARWCLVRIWAAGGSGGRGGAGDGGGGGGGGAYIEKVFDYADLSNPVSVIIGTGGAAQTSDDTAGNVGGNTTFGAYLTAYGGGGGGAVTSVYGGGGGGGTTSVGSVGSGSAGGTGGGPAGGYYTATTGVGRHSSFGGGSGGGAGPIAAGDSGWGGGGGGGGTATTGNGVGGDSLYGGGGGGGGSDTGTPSAGGTSVFGGAGGAGATDVATGTAGTQPGGGGGGSENANSGAGGDGKAVIISF
jgi:hypothetical protein